MKRRKQIGKLIYTPRWDQGDVVLSDDYEGLTRGEKLEVLAHWITALLSKRNAMIANPKSWHHFMGDKSWEGLTDEEIDQGLLRSDYAFKTAEAWRAGVVFAMTKLKEKNT